MDNDQRYIEIFTQAYDRAPKQVQQYLSSGEFEVFLKRLKDQFRLSDGMAGDAGNEILMSILNIVDPKELAVGLEVDAHIPEELLDPMLDEIRKAIFGPLREKMEKDGVIPAAKPADVPAPAPINRLTPAAKPTPVTPVVPPAPAAAPVAAVVAKPPVPKPFGADVAAPLVKAAAPIASPMPPTPPSIALKTRPGESAGPLSPKKVPSLSKMDPYREMPD